MDNRDRREYNRQWREANKERRKEYQKKYREANKERLAENEKAYREANSGKIKEREKKYREANKEKRSIRNKEWNKKNKEKRHEYNKKRYHEVDKIKIEKDYKSWLLSKIKKIKNRSELTIEHLIEIYKQQDGNCAISGLPMTTRFNDHRAISIDRIDSSKGYEVGNVQLVCTALNLAKKHHSNESIIEFVQLIRESKVI